jgi:hypothetical protein
MADGTAGGSGRFQRPWGHSGVKVSVVLHRPADSRTAQALAHPLPAPRLHTNICY